MRYYSAVLVALVLAGAGLAIAPPQGPPPSIVPSPPITVPMPPTTPPPTTGGHVGPGGGPTTPEPSTLTIALVSAAAAGSLRFLRRKN